VFSLKHLTQPLLPVCFCCWVMQWSGRCVSAAAMWLQEVDVVQEQQQCPAGVGPSSSTAGMVVGQMVLTLRRCSQARAAF
jgi:hypothetical protein